LAKENQERTPNEEKNIGESKSRGKVHARRLPETAEVLRNQTGFGLLFILKKY